MWLRIVAIALVLMLSARSPEAQSSRHASELVGSWTGQLDGLAGYPVQVSIDRLTAEGEVTGRYQFRNDAPLLFRERVRDTSFTFARGSSFFTFALQPDGSLRATRQFPGGMNTILLQRVGLTPPPARAAALPGSTRTLCNTPGVPVPRGTLVYSGRWRGANDAPGAGRTVCMAVVVLPQVAAAALGEGYNGYYVWGDGPSEPRNGSSRVRVQQTDGGGIAIRFNSGSTVTLGAPGGNGRASGRFEHVSDPRQNGVADDLRVERL